MACLVGCGARPIATRPGDPLRDSPAGLEPVTLESGLRYQDLRRGDGRAVPDRDDQEGVVIEVRYEGRLTDQRVFDRTGQTTRRFELGRLLAGWRQGLAGMREGGIRKLVIPARLGYSDAGSPAFGVPPGAELTYVIELVRLNAPGQRSRAAQRPVSSSSKPESASGQSSGQSLGKPHVIRLGSPESPPIDVSK